MKAADCLEMEGFFFLGGGVVAQVGQKKTWVSLRYWKKQRLGPVQKLERA